MAVIINGTTGVTFNDATLQGTAFFGGRGQVFTSSGNFTVPTGITAAKVTVIGGGGSGATVTGTNSGGGGGGGGGVAVKYVLGLTPGTLIAVTVGGVAGTSSFGTECSATGGATAATVTAASAGGSGGAGGVGSSGTINITGSNGSSGLYALTVSVGGVGGGSSGSLSTAPTISVFGCGSAVTSGGAPGIGFYSGGGGASQIDDANGIAATGYGNGGGGAHAVSVTDRTGGVGSGGIVIVEY